MLVRDVMTAKPQSVGPDASVDEALNLLSRYHVTSLPVVMGDLDLVGIVSEADLMVALVARDPRAHQIPVGDRPDAPRLVREVMTPEPYVTRDSEDVSELAAVMAEHGWKSIPVVERGRLVGMVSRSDVIRALARPDDEVRADLLAVFEEFGHGDWQVSIHAGAVDVTGPATDDQREAARSAAGSIRGVRRITFDRAAADGSPSLGT